MLLSSIEVKQNKRQTLDLYAIYLYTTYKLRVRNYIQRFFPIKTEMYHCKNTTNIIIVLLSDKIGCKKLIHLSFSSR